MTEFCELLRKKTDLIGISLTEEQLEQFETYYEMLVETNKVMNLTAITEWHEVIDKHFVDSLSLTLASGVFTGKEKIIDVGTGAGFPGVPLKIAFPELSVTCLDSLNKRMEFLNRVFEKCGLKNIETIHGRAEDFGRDKKYREKYDMAVSRAVARMEVLSEYCTPFVKVGGIFVSYKSGLVDEEIGNAKHALSVLKCHVEDCKKFVLPETDMERSLVIIRKEKNTPGAYPRKAGTPGKAPL